MGSHNEGDYFFKFKDYGYRNSDIVKFCMILVKYVKYIKDYSLSRGYDRGYYERRFHDYIYGKTYSNQPPDETSKTTIGYIKTRKFYNQETQKEEKKIELKHDYKSWGDVLLPKDLLKSYYKESGIEIQEYQKIRVEFKESFDHFMNRTWIATRILEKITPESLILE